MSFNYQLFRRGTQWRASSVQLPVTGSPSLYFGLYGVHWRLVCFC